MEIGSTSLSFIFSVRNWINKNLSYRHFIFSNESTHLLTVIFVSSHYAVQRTQVRGLWQVPQTTTDQLMGTTNGIGGMTCMLFFRLPAPSKTMTFANLFQYATSHLWIVQYIHCICWIQQSKWAVRAPLHHFGTYHEGCSWSWRLTEVPIFSSL